jgi:predicted TIM-barrel fold metal-dependent hydrolase
VTVAMTVAINTGAPVKAKTTHWHRDGSRGRLLHECSPLGIYTGRGIAMKMIDGHSHMYQTYGESQHLKTRAEQIDGFDIKTLLARLDALDIAQFQTMPQEMTRVRGLWLGSNDLSADLHRSAPTRIVSFAAAEPMDAQDVFNRARLMEVEAGVLKNGLKGLLLTPPYGHYYANDKRVYPFYEKALALDIPIYFHHSHNFGPSRYCPLKYARPYLLDDLTIDFPDLRFNIEHMGYPWTEEVLAIMSRSPNVYTDIAMFVAPTEDFAKGRRLLLARNLGMAREYGVLGRVFYGSDYVGEDMVEYVDHLQQEIAYIQNGLNRDMEKQGFPPLDPAEMQGLLCTNVLKLWKGKDEV